VTHRISEPAKDPSEPKWRESSICSHSNNNACATCDFDRYYAKKFPETCPWADNKGEDDE
jgi:hypothetical protein